MTVTAGIDVGSTYTKVTLMDENHKVIARTMQPTGFKLGAVAERCFAACLEEAGIARDGVAYIVSTGFGRHQVDFKDVSVTELTAAARGAALAFPGTHTILDIGGQTMKAIRIDDELKVRAFRLNDKCAAGTGAFLEKTARYMGYSTDEIGGLLKTSKDPADISGVCAVFAESEVINHLSIGTAPGDIMQGSIESLVARSVQLMKRVKAEPEYTVIGGIMRFPTMEKALVAKLQSAVNLPENAEDVQFTTSTGAALLGHRRLAKLAEGAAA